MLTDAGRDSLREGASKGGINRWIFVTSWTHERVCLLKALWALGKSASNIAQEMDITRNAVIGKVHRLQLPARRVERERKVRQGGSRRSKTIVRRELKARRQTYQYGNRGHRVFDTVDVGWDLAASHADKPSSLLDLSPNGCHWPCEGEGIKAIFCGGKKLDGYPYCPRHCRMAYRRRTA